MHHFAISANLLLLSSETNTNLHNIYTAQRQDHLLHQPVSEGYKSPSHPTSHSAVPTHNRTPLMKVCNRQTSNGPNDYLEPVLDGHVTPENNLFIMGTPIPAAPPSQEH
ncbi:hypothetical protein PGT21_036436 [Puccinia graminis f. sp. tritici]|uniref:Uncharacterized protein n=1 Tax=Puccinia graminis f. sp. tritici TaxID=56615 RepID=A0A5B0R2U0_PUCGR|nr:hypothetical protein PGT21_036436 [Puccinia graminis f. sp. tritici]